MTGTGLTLNVLDAPRDHGGEVVETVEEAMSGSSDRFLVEVMEFATVTLAQDQWLTVDGALDRRDGALEIVWSDGETFEGRFREKDGSGVDTRLIIHSYNIDARESEPTGGEVIYENVPDSDIVTDLIEGNDSIGVVGVPTVDIGTVETVDPAISFSMSHARPSTSIADLAKATGAEVYYDGPKIFYVERRGADKSDSVTLSPENRNLLGDVNIARETKNVEEQIDTVTHIRGFGAQQGEEQLTYTAVWDGYDGGRQVWLKYEDKEIVQPDRLEKVVENLIDEVNEFDGHLEIECGTREFDLEVGDDVHVEIPGEGIDEVLRIKERARVTDREGDRLRLALTNNIRTDMREDMKRLKDLRAFNRGSQGYLTPYTWTSGWDHAGDGTPQATKVKNWPDNIVDEISVELHVDVREWRSPVTDEGHDHPFSLDLSHGHNTTGHTHPFSLDLSHGHNTTGHTHPIDESTFEHTHPVPISATSDSTTPIGNTTTKSVSTWSGGTDESLTGFNENATVLVIVSGRIPSGETEPIALRIDGPTVNHRPGSGYNADAEWAAAVYAAPADHSGTITLTNDTRDGNVNNIDLENVVMVGIGYPLHSHPVNDTATSDTTSDNVTASSESKAAVVESSLDIESSTTDAEAAVVSSSLGVESSTTDAKAALIPEIVTEFDGSTPPLPTDVEIAIDGQTVTTLAGDADNPWDATVDLTGELTPGDSQITALPGNGRGEINLTFTAEVFRKGRSSG